MDLHLIIRDWILSKVLKQRLQDGYDKLLK